MAKQPDVNSPDYWDQRFQEDWSAHGGHHYTNAYSELVMEHLPEHLTTAMRRERLSICDWGCAEGEAVSYFSQVFPGQCVCGVDVSQTAVENAKRKYPSLNFIAADWLQPDTELPSFDVVFTSHVLEHFPNPIAVLNNVLARVATKMIVALMPFAENPETKDPEHFFRFLDSNLPVRWAGWSCVFFLVLDTRMRKGHCWRGQQVLVVYAENDWIEKESLSCFLNSFRGETEVLKQDLAARQRKITEQEYALALSAKKLEIQFMHDQHFVRVNENQRYQITSLTNKQEELTREHGKLKKEHGELKKEHEGLKKEHEGLGKENEGLKTQYQSAQVQIGEKSAQIAQLTHRNEQLRDDLARTERAYADTRAILKWPPAVAKFYAGALWHRIQRLWTGNQQAAKSARPNSQTAKQAQPCPGNQALPAAVTLAEKSSPANASDLSTTASAISPAPSAILTEPSKTSEAPQAPKITPAPRTSVRKESWLKHVQAASILDTFSHACLAPDCTLLPLGPLDWRDALESQPPDFLFVESAWHGNNGSWQYRIASYAKPAGAELDDVLHWCNKKDIPTVFWNKEDPPNFDRFIAAAEKFDYVFTTDANCIAEYCRRCGHDRVASLPFAAQPAIHNPVQKMPRFDKVCFAGTYYADCFPERRRHMEQMLGGSIIYGLDIFDRMFGHEGIDKARFLFPEQFQPYIRGKLNYDEMLEAYRQYRAFLNVNSVHDSPTMFARRVFELLACGTPVISTPSLGMEQLFGDLVPQVRTDGETRKALQPLLEDERVWKRQSALGVRLVMSGHTYSHRLQTVCKTIGLETAADREPPCVVVLTPGNRAERIAGELAAQSIRPRRVYVLGGDADSAANRAALHAAGFDALEMPLDRLTGVVRQEHADCALAFMNGKHAYGPEYLCDGLQPLFYSGCDATGMDEHFTVVDGDGAVLMPGEKPPCFIHESCLGSTLVLRATALNEDVLDRVVRETRFQSPAPCYLRPPFEFVANPPEMLTDAVRSITFI